MPRNSNGTVEVEMTSIQAQTSDPEIEPAMEPEIVYPSGPKFWLVFSSLAACSFMLGLDNSILATAVPAITNDYHTINNIGWYFAAPTLTNAAFQIMFGKMYSIYAVKPLLAVTIVLFAVSSVTCALAPTSMALILGRAFSGLSAAGMFSGLLKMSTINVPLHRRPFIGGISAACEITALGMGPIVGGLLVDSVGWRFCFWINVPIAVISLVIFLVVYESPAHDRPDTTLDWKDKLKKLNLLGTAILVPSIICFLIAIQWGSSSYGWKDPRVIVLLALFALLFVTFSYLQYRQGDEAIIPARIFKRRSIAAGMLFAACANSALAIASTYFPIYTQTVLGLSARDSGLLSLPSVVGMLLSIALSSTIISKVGYYTPLMLLGSMISPVAAGLLTTLPLHEDFVKIILYQGFLGFAIGVGFTGPQMAAQTVLSTRDVSMGLSIVLFAQMLGPAVTIAGAQALFQSRLFSDIEQSVPGLNTTSLSNIGLGELKSTFGPKAFAHALRGYDEAVDQVFYLPLALMCLSLIGSACMEWTSIKKKQS